MRLDSDGDGNDDDDDNEDDDDGGGDVRAARIVEGEYAEKKRSFY